MHVNELKTDVKQKNNRLSLMYCTYVILRIICGIALLFVGFRFVSIQLFPEQFQKGFILSPECSAALPNVIFGVLVTVSAWLVVRGIYLIIVLGLIGSIIYFILDTIWLINTKGEHMHFGVGLSLVCIALFASLLLTRYKHLRIIGISEHKIMISDENGVFFSCLSIFICVLIVLSLNEIRKPIYIAKILGLKTSSLHFTNK